MKFVSKDLALKLKKQGFNKPCFGYYYIETPTGYNEGEIIYNKCSTTREVIYKDCLYSSNYDYYFDVHLVNKVDAPTIEQVLEWLREKDIMVFPVYSKNTSRWYCEIINANSLESYKLLFPNSYESACIEGIKYIVNNLI